MKHTWRTEDQHGAVVAYLIFPYRHKGAYGGYTVGYVTPSTVEKPGQWFAKLWAGGHDYFPNEQEARDWLFAVAVLTYERPPL